MSIMLIDENNQRTSAAPEFDVPRNGFEEIAPVNKFGETTNADSGVNTDIWDRANATDAQAVWLAPTAARVHAIVSASANDDVGNTGCSSVQIWGLTDWDTDEVTEVIAMDGATPVNTVNSYVIIHRMKGLAFGSANTNVGNITATAATDSTVTAMILATKGQTLMAVYGIPSTKCGLMTNFDFGIIKAAAAMNAELAMWVNETPNTNSLSFIVKHTYGLESAGSSSKGHVFNPFKRIAGPAVIKFQVNTSANNTTISGGFDLYVVDV